MSGTTLISSLQFPDFVDTVDRVHNKGEMLVEDLAQVRSLFIEENIPSHTGDERIYDEYDTETYARYKAEGADASKVKAIKGWNKKCEMRRFAAEIDITWEMRNVGKDQTIIRRMTSLATYCPQRMALDLTHVFTFATSTSYTDMDGETVDVAMGYTTSTALVDSTHDLTGSTATYSNVITGTPYFSPGAFQVARERTNTQIVSNFNERRTYPFNTIVTGDDPATCDEVEKYLKSSTDITQNNPGVVNPGPKFRHVVLPRLATDAQGAYDSDKAKWWFYIAVGEWQGHLGIWESPNLITPTTSNNGADIHNDNWTFGTRGAYGRCTVTGKGLVGSCP